MMIVPAGEVNPAKEARRTRRLVIRLARTHGDALSPMHMSEEDF